MEATPLQAGDGPEHRAWPAAVLRVPRRKALDELKALPAFRLELTRTVRHVLGRGGCAVRPRHSKEHEFQQGHWKRRTSKWHLHLAERGLQHLVAVPEHLGRGHPAPASRGRGRELLDPGANRVSDAGIVEPHRGLSPRVERRSTDPSCGTQTAHRSTAPGPERIAARVVTPAKTSGVRRCDVASPTGRVAATTSCRRWSARPPSRRNARSRQRHVCGDGRGASAMRSFDSSWRSGPPSAALTTVRAQAGSAHGPRIPRSPRVGRSASRPRDACVARSTIGPEARIASPTTIPEPDRCRA